MYTGTPYPKNNHAANRPGFASFASGRLLSFEIICYYLIVSKKRVENKWTNIKFAAFKCVDNCSFCQKTKDTAQGVFLCGAVIYSFGAASVNSSFTLAVSPARL